MGFVGARIVRMIAIGARIAGARFVGTIDFGMTGGTVFHGFYFVGEVHLRSAGKRGQHQLVLFLHFSPYSGRTAAVCPERRWAG